MRNKAGRMLMANELKSDHLVMAKLEDNPRIFSAWIRHIEDEEITIKLLLSGGGRRKKRQTIHGRKHEDGLVVDESGKCIFLWEYLNLDGTPYKPERESESV